jgi:hypothetical protein
MRTSYKLLTVTIFASSMLSSFASGHQEAQAGGSQAPAAQVPAANAKATSAAKSPKAATAAKTQTAASSKPQAEAAGNATLPTKKTPAAGAKPGTKAVAPLTLETEKAKQSYALGMNVGAGLQRQMADIDPDILARGLKDALAGRKTLLSDEEARTALTQLQNGLRKKQMDKMQEVSEGNKKAGQAFLAANKEKDGVERIAVSSPDRRNGTETDGHRYCCLQLQGDVAGWQRV